MEKKRLWATGFLVNADICFLQLVQDCVSSKTTESNGRNFRPNPAH